jgi:hypothetical protein
MIEVEIVLEMRETEKEIQDNKCNNDCNWYRLVKLINDFFYFQICISEQCAQIKTFADFYLK